MLWCLFSSKPSSTSSKTFILSKLLSSFSGSLKLSTLLDCNFLFSSQRLWFILFVMKFKIFLNYMHDYFTKNDSLLGLELSLPKWNFFPFWVENLRSSLLLPLKNPFCSSVVILWLIIELASLNVRPTLSIWLSALFFLFVYSISDLFLYLE